MAVLRTWKRKRIADSYPFDRFAVSNLSFGRAVFSSFTPRRIASATPVSRGKWRLKEVMLRFNLSEVASPRHRWRLEAKTVFPRQEASRDYPNHWLCVINALQEDPNKAAKPSGSAA
jgi:hypothetical protein